MSRLVRLRECHFTLLVPSKWEFSKEYVQTIKRLLQCTVLKKVLMTLLGLFGAPTVIQRPHNDSAPGELCPLWPPRYSPAQVLIAHREGAVHFADC